MNHGTLTSYVIGFISSIVLTLAAFLFVIYSESGALQLNSNALIAIVLVLAAIQLIVQMVFFFHLGSRSGGYWNLAIFISTICLVLLIVIGSIWIMNHLNYNMTPTQILQYIQGQATF